MPWYVDSMLLAVALSMDAFAVSLSNGLTNKKIPVRYMIITALFFGLFQGVMPLIGYLLGSIFEEWISVAIPIIGFAVLSFLGIKMIVDSAKEIKEEKKAKLALLEGQDWSEEGEVNPETAEDTIVVEEIATNGATAVATTDMTAEGDFSVTTAVEMAETEIAIEENVEDCNIVATSNIETPLDEDKPFKFSWKMLLIQSIATSIDALMVGLNYIGKGDVEVYVTFALIAVITFGICVWGVFFGKKFGEKLKSKAGIFGGVILIALALKTIIQFLVERFA